MKKQILFYLFLLFISFQSFAQTYTSGLTGAEIDAGARPYKVYTALVQKIGAQNPTVIVLENTIGNIVWTRYALGKDRATLTGAFTSGKTIVFLGTGNNQPLIYDTPVSVNNSDYGFWYATTTDYIQINKGYYDASQGILVWADGYYYISIEIRVYP